MCGGGTMGPVTPLMAVARAWKRLDPTIEMIWAITPDGPEAKVLQDAGYQTFPIPVAKIPRYASWELLTWPVRYWKALRASKKLLDEQKPALIASAGGFTAAPMMRSAEGMHIPCVIHQLDREPGLTNQMSAGLATLLTSSFPMGDAFHRIVEVVPTPNRFAGRVLADRLSSAEQFGFTGNRPIVLLIGGGTGSLALNTWMAKHVDELTKLSDVIQVFGSSDRDIKISDHAHITRRAFLSEEELFTALSCADIVVTRAGMGALSDLATLKKSAVIVPIRNSHQVANTKMMPYPTIQEGADFDAGLMGLISRLVSNPDERKRLGDEASRMLVTDDGTELAKRWMKTQ